MIRRPYGSLPLCESRRSLDVRRLHRDGRLGAGQTFPYSWSSGGEPYGTIDVRIEGYSIVLTFRARRSQDDEWRSVVEQAIPIVYTRCHFGRSRPWFRCSAHSSGRLCGRRVAVVYCAGESFACRNCCRLAYASQREALRYRGLGKARKIRMRLGGSLNLLEDFPEKPKGMHRRTYDRLRRTSDIAEERLTVGLVRAADQLSKRSSRRD